MKPSRTSRFLTGALLLYAYQGLTMIVGLWLAPFLLTRLGQHDFGVWIVAFQFLSYLQILDFGVVALLPREVAYVTGRTEGGGGSAELTKMIGQTSTVILCQMPVVVLASVAAWFMVPDISANFRSLISLVLVVFVLTFPFRVFAAVLQGLQDAMFLGITNLIYLILSNAITVALIFKGFGIHALAISWAVIQVVTVAASAYRIRMRYPGTFPDRLPRLTFAEIRRFLGRGAWISINQIAQPMLVGSDVMAIGRLSGPAAVVPFTSTGKLSGVLGNQPQILMTMAIPGLSELKADASKERIYNVTMALTLSVLILCGAIVTGVLAINQGFVSRWMGSEQYGGIVLTTLLGLCMLIRQYNLTAQYTTYCCGDERRITIAVFIDGLVTIAATFGFVWLLGPIGAPLGSILGVCLISLPSNLKALARETGKPVSSLVMPLRTWLWRFLLVAAVAILTSHFWPPLTILEIGIHGVLVVLLYLGLVWPVAMRSPLGEYLLKLIASARMRLFGASVPSPTPS